MSNEKEVGRSGRGGAGGKPYDENGCRLADPYRRIYADPDGP